MKSFVSLMIAPASLVLLNGCGGGGDVHINMPLSPVADVRNTDFVARESFAFSLDGAARRSLRLEAINGSVAVSGDSTSNSIAVAGEREVGSDSLLDAQVHLQQLEVEVQDVGADILVRTKQPQNPGGRSYVVNYRLKLPGALELSIAGVNGSLNLGGTVGNVDTSLVNGSTEAALAVPAGGSITMSAINGDIDLHLPQTTSAVFSAQTAIGTISLMALALQNEVRTNTSLRGSFGTGNGTVSLRTTNGTIRVDAMP